MRHNNSATFWLWTGVVLSLIVLNVFVYRQWKSKQQDGVPTVEANKNWRYVVVGGNTYISCRTYGGYWVLTGPIPK